MSVKPAKVQFNGGELSPWLEGRTDIAKYDKTAKLCRNFIPLAEGSLKRRGGTHFVAATPEADEVIITISADPADADVSINGIAANSAKVARGDEVVYRVSADGFIGQSGTLNAEEDKTLEIELTAKNEMYRLTVEPLPQDAEVVLNGYVRKSVRVLSGDVVSYTVSKDGYVTRMGSMEVTETKIVKIELQQETAA